MAVLEKAPAPPLPLARRAPLRLYLLGRAFVLMITSMTGVALFSIWISFVAVSPVSIVAPLLIPLTALVRRYANLRRRGAQYLLGVPITAEYRRPTRPGIVDRVWTIVRDPQSWRDALWCLLHGIVGCVASALSVALFFGGVLYLIYPFLFWVTPQRVFGRPFGGLLHLHTVGQASIVMPLALVLFGLWYVLAVPLARADVALTRRMLGRRG